MKVSVIVPNYRHASYLPERIESILNQHYEDFELILLDDCSSDNSREVLERYRNHPKVSHIVFNETNSGSTFLQWDKGFSLAQGEYIWIAESDDYADPDFLEKCMEQFEAHPSCVLVYTESRIVDSRSMPHPKIFKQAKHSKNACDIWQGREFVLQNMVRCNTIYNASMVVFRKSAIPLHRNYTRFRLNGDWLFWIEICLQGDVAHINLKLNAFRQHEEKVSVEQTRNGVALSELIRLYSHLVREVDLPIRTRQAIQQRIRKTIRKRRNKIRSSLRNRSFKSENRRKVFAFKRWPHLFYKVLTKLK